MFGYKHSFIKYFRILLRHKNSKHIGSIEASAYNFRTGYSEDIIFSACEYMDKNNKVLTPVYIKFLFDTQTATNKRTEQKHTDKLKMHT